MGQVYADGMPAPQRQWAFAAIIITLALAVIDSSVANVALPTIAEKLHAAPAASIIVVTAYQLAIVVALMPLSALGDVYGYRQVYLGGIIVFTLASLGCAFSHSLDALTASRTFQGLGAAGIMSVNAALLRYIFPQNRLGRAFANNALVISLAATVGPSFASVVLGIASWPWLFAINVPLGVLAYIMGVRSLPWSARSGHRFDVLSAVLTAASFGLMVTSINSVSRGAAWWRVAAEVGCGAASGLWAVRRQLHVPAPLLPVDLLRIPLLALSVGTSVCTFAAQMLAFVALPFYMQSTLGIRATAVGFYMMPWPFAIAIAAPIVGRLADRYPGSLLSSVGLSVLAIGLICLATLPHSPGAVDVSWRMALCGVGFAMFQAINNRIIITAAPKARSGAASGIVGTARLLGQSIGAALVALMLARAPDRGAQFSLFLGAAFAAAAGIVSIFRKFQAASA